MLLSPDGGPLTVEGVCALRTALSAAGFHWYPEITGRKQSTKEVGTWVGKAGTFDPQMVYQNHYGPLLNTALYCDGMFAIDVDVDAPEWVWRILEPMAAHLGPPLAVRLRANAPRVLVLYRCAEDDAVYASLRGSDGMVEVFTGPRQKVTAFGVHTCKDTGVRTRLYWNGVPGNLRKSDLPLVTSAQRDAFLAAIHDMLGDEVVTRRGRHPGDAADAAGDGSKVARDVAALCAALAWIPNHGAMDWHAWNRIGMALWVGSGGAACALQAWCAWTAQNPLTAHRDCVQRWRAYAGSPPSRLGAGTIFYHARQAGWRGVYQPTPLTLTGMSWQQKLAQATLANRQYSI